MFLILHAWTVSVFIIIVPDPQFVSTSYIVAENNRGVPLCIDFGVQLLQETTYFIAAVQNDPPQAQG